MPFDRERLKAKFAAGDYKSLRDFAEREGVSLSYVQKLSASDAWYEARAQLDEVVAQKIKDAGIERSVESFYEKRRVTLGIISRLKERADEILDKKSCDAKDLNALASAIYRCNEVERGLMPETQSTSDLDKLISEIRDAAREDSDGE